LNDQPQATATAPSRANKLTPTELIACRADPTLAWTIRGPKWIACIEEECGFVGEQLGQHLRVIHNLTALQYKQTPGLDGRTPRYSKGASLLSRELRERLSKKRRKLRFGKRLHDSGKVPTVEKLIASRGRRVLSQQYRIEQGRRMKRARPELWGKWRGKNLTTRGEDWQIARLAADGVSDREIAIAIGLANGQSAGARRRRLGFTNSKKARVYDHGRPLTMDDLLATSRDLNKPPQQMADEMGLKYSTLERRTRSSRRAKPLSTKIGRAFRKRLAKWRQEYRRTAASHEGGRPLLLLPSERQKMRREYKALLPELKTLLQFAEKAVANDASLDFAGLRNLVYSEARSGRLRTLAMWPSFFDWISGRKDLLPGFLRGQLKSFRLAFEFLGATYGVRVGTIRAAIRPAVATT
jgi:hypothetical protein